MENLKDPRMQIPADLNHVQKNIEDAADNRKKEIKDETKQELSTLKNEMKDLKNTSKECYKRFKDEMKDSNDPAKNEKISAAKAMSKVTEKNIQTDYEVTKHSIEDTKDNRLNSIDNMMSDND